MNLDTTQTVLLTTGLTLLGVALSYFGIAFTSVLLGAPSAPPPVTPLDLGAFRALAQHLPAEETLLARDGTPLRFRRYGSPGAPLTLVLLHGSGGQSSYWSVLGHHLASSEAAEVITPDLRGHGHSGGRSGDVSYIGQLDDDLAEVVAAARREHPERRVVIGGHSMGGGLALRGARQAAGQALAGVLLLAPYLRHDAPTTRPGSGGWASPNLGRMVGLTMLNQLGLRGLNDLDVLHFNIPTERRDGTTPAYSFRLYRSLAPAHHEADIAALTVPTLVLVGERDPIFDAAQYPAAFASNQLARVQVLPDRDHLDVVWRPEALESITTFLRSLSVTTPAARLGPVPRALAASAE